MLDVKPAHVGGLLATPAHPSHRLADASGVHPQLLLVHASGAADEDSRAARGSASGGVALAENDDPTAIKAGPARGEPARASSGVHSSDVQRYGMPRAQGARGRAGTARAASQRIITMFFKSLTPRSTEVVDIAKQAQRDSAAVAQQGAAAVQLATNLRNLAHYKNLTMPLLSGLERLRAPVQQFNPTLERNSSSTCVDGSSRQGGGQGDSAAGATSSQGHQDGRDDQPVPPPSSGGGQVPRTPVMLTMQPEKALPPSGVHSEVNRSIASPSPSSSRDTPRTRSTFLARLAQPAFSFVSRHDSHEGGGEHPRGARRRQRQDYRRGSRAAPAPELTRRRTRKRPRG